MDFFDLNLKIKDSNVFEDSLGVGILAENGVWYDAAGNERPAVSDETIANELSKRAAASNTYQNSSSWPSQRPESIC